MSRLRISASALKTWDTCQEKWRLSRLYTDGKPSSEMQEGLDVHAAMAKMSIEGGGVQKNLSRRVEMFVGNLTVLEEHLGLTIVGREVKQEWEIRHKAGVDGSIHSAVDIVRIIDAYGYDKDGPVLIDYKTTSNSRTWTPFMEYPSPLAKDWQSVVYLLPPPPQVEHPFETWPTRMYFLVTTVDEIVGVFGVNRDLGREQELWARMNELINFYDTYHLDWAPRTFGYHCHNAYSSCPFVSLCYDVPGAIKGYRKKDET